MSAVGLAGLFWFRPLSVRERTIELMSRGRFEAALAVLEDRVPGTSLAGGAGKRELLAAVVRLRKAVEARRFQDALAQAAVSEASAHGADEAPDALPERRLLLGEITRLAVHCRLVLSRDHRAHGRLSEARRQLEGILNADVGQAETCLVRAQQFLGGIHAGRATPESAEDQAAAAFREAARIAPVDARPRAWLADLLRALGKAEEADRMRGEAEELVRCYPVPTNLGLAVAEP